jgi:biopolymer transport protein ExbB
VTGFTLREMMTHGWPVLTVLLAMSILSLTVIVERFIVLRRARCDARRFAARLLRTLEQQGQARGADLCLSVGKPVAAVLREVIEQPGPREAKERACEHAISAQLSELGRLVPILGTIASTAPFVGLLGTVLGIIRAFRDIAANIGSGPEVVAAGIAEALITTAFGLIVAIPAVIGFNYFVHQNQRLADDIELAAYDVIERIARQDTPSP